MRQQPDYESALETQELMGTIVEIVGESGYWREIISPQPYRAWTTEKCLIEMSEEELKAYEDAPKVMFTGLYGHIYSTPSTQSCTVCDLVGGDIMRLADSRSLSNNGKLKGKWIEVLLPSGMNGFVHGVEYVNGFAYYKIILIVWDVLAAGGLAWLGYILWKKINKA